MTLTNKFNKNIGSTPNLNLYEKKVYTAKVVNDHYLDESGKTIALRKLLQLEQDPIYRTQFYNEELGNAVLELNELTKIEYFDENNKKIIPLGINPVLVKERSSIICEREPDPSIKYVSIVIYTAQNQNDLLTKDGSVLMNQGYNPIYNESLVTKKWVENLISDFSATLVSSNAPKIETEFHKGIYYGNNLEYPFVFYESKGKSLDTRIRIRLDNIVIPSSYSKETTFVSLIINDYQIDKTLLTEVIEGSNNIWGQLSSENIYGEIPVDDFYFKKSFYYEHLASYLLKYAAKDQNIYSIKFRFSNNLDSFDSEAITIGLDKYITDPTDTQIELKYNQSKLESWKTKKVSGISYFPKDDNLFYELPIECTVSNNFLCNFRSDFNVTAESIDIDGGALDRRELKLDSHIPLQGDLYFNNKISFNCNVKLIRIKIFNVIGELVGSKDFLLDVLFEDSDETLRATTPSGSIQFPSKDYGAEWDSSNSLNEWDMRLRNSKYTIETEEGAVCFKIDPRLECYSHLNFDIEHNGEMYVKSQGNTGWLDCSKKMDLFTIPTKDGDPCVIDEKNVSFGRIVYNTPVYIRIIKATQVIFNSASLG